MKKRLTKFRVMSMAMLTLLLSLVTGTVYAYDFTLQTNSSTFSPSGADYVATSNGVTFTYAKGGYTSAISGGVADNQLRVYKMPLLPLVHRLVLLILLLMLLVIRVLQLMVLLLLKVLIHIQQIN